MFELRRYLGIYLVVLRNTRSTVVRTAGRQTEILMFDQKYKKKMYEYIERESVRHQACRYFTSYSTFKCEYVRRNTTYEEYRITNVFVIFGCKFKR